MVSFPGKRRVENALVSVNSDKTKAEAGKIDHMLVQLGKIDSQCLGLFWRTMQPVSLGEAKLPGLKADLNAAYFSFLSDLNVVQ